MPSDVQSPSPQVLRSQRVLACVLCQQRKVKCDRKFPCANCVKSRAQCVPATQVQRRRKRRFPEKDLLDRLRRYEDLLRQNDIAFDPLHKDSLREKDEVNAERREDPDEEQSEATGHGTSTMSVTNESEKGYEAKNVWHAMSHDFRDPDNDSDSSHDEVRADVVKKAWDHLMSNDDHLLFGSRKSDVDLSTLHPNPAQIFRLWQIYLDNVNSLLKVTHIPSLQARIVEAAGDVSGIDPVLEALLFGIYCTAVLSLNDEDCQRVFKTSKNELLVKYQFGCQQALLNHGILRTSDRDCLTAFYLYLLSIRPSTVPQALYSMLGIAIRIAQRIGIHNEAMLSKCNIFEAEMCRRLWWSLVHFDARTSELADHKTSVLDPTWDCRIPLNVNDSDLRPEMREPPAAQGRCTEAVFAVVRSEVCDFVRHTDFHLDFNNPALKAIARHVQTGKSSEGDELTGIEDIIEDRYLRFCDQENPVHFMTVWTTRAYLSKCRLFQHHSMYSGSLGRQTDVQRDSANSHALRTLECDTKIMTSTLTRGFDWMNQFHFPFPAYMQLLQDMKRRPTGKFAEKAWKLMNENHAAWFDLRLPDEGPFFQIFARMVSQAWEAYEAVSSSNESPMAPPRIVLYVQNVMERIAQGPSDTSTQQPEVDIDVMIDDFTMPMPMNFPGQSMPYTMGVPGGFEARPYMYPGQLPTNPSLAPFNPQGPGGVMHGFMRF